MKKCNICKLDKDVSEYHRSSSSKDGLQYRCKKCEKTRHAEYYKNNKERLSAYASARYYKKKGNNVKDTSGDSGPTCPLPAQQQPGDLVGEID